MSILVVLLTAEGITFAADRNVTSTFQIVEPQGEIRARQVGHSQRPKVLRWPNRQTIIGYVGNASIGGQTTDLWLYEFIGRNLEFGALDPIAALLAEELEGEMAGMPDEHRGTVVHLAQFEERDAGWIPVISYVRDVEVVDRQGTLRYLPHMEARDELARPDYFGSKTGPEIREALAKGWFSFRQGCYLPVFNDLDHALWEFRKTIPADTLSDWEQRAKLSVLGYAAYFGAYWPPDQQLVGGGVDAVSIRWPE